MSETRPKEITLEMIRSTLYTAVVCDALDALGYRAQSPAAPLVAQTGCEKLVGRCRTTLWADMVHEDPRPYELELKAVDSCQSGDVLIAAAGGSMRSGIWGELLSTAAMTGGCAGAIVDGAVRDVDKMTAMKFPVFARGRRIYDSLHRQRVIDIDVPVEIGGVIFSPGDLVIADMDGLVVVPRAVEAEAIGRAWEKVFAENAVRDAIRGGMKAGEAFEKFGVL
jgi:regulator of RNase E activity RraA